MASGGKQTNSEGLVGEKVDLASLLNYQDAAVVSRTILDKPAGTVTLFAFDANEGLSEHTAPYNALVYLLDGSLQVTVSGRPHELQPGDMLIMPADEPHALRATSRCKMLLVMIRS